MASKIATTMLPAKEFRRKYMKRLIEDIASMCNVDEDVAKVTADTLISFLSKKIHSGERLNFGFVSVIPKKKKATVVKSHLRRLKKSVFYMGDQVRWVVAVAKAWQNETKPDWSKYS